MVNPIYADSGILFQFHPYGNRSSVLKSKFVRFAGASTVSNQTTALILERPSRSAFGAPQDEGAVKYSKLRNQDTTLS